MTEVTSGVPVTRAPAAPGRWRRWVAGRTGWAPLDRTAWESPDRRAIVTIVLFAVVAIASTAVLPDGIAGAGLLVLGALFLLRRWVFDWNVLLFALLAVIMFVPIRRYALPIPLPFALEPYRVIIVGMIIGIVVAVSANPRFTWRPVVFAWPIGLFLASQIVSVLVNSVELTETMLVDASITNILQLVLLTAVFFLVRQLLDGEDRVHRVLLFITWAGIVVGFFAVFERLSGVNVFLELDNFLPLQSLRDAGESVRAGGQRSYASSQHPIALAVALCLVIPIAVYLARYAGWPRNEVSRRILYGLGIVAMVGGILVTVSRTGIVVLGVMVLLTMLLVPRVGILLVSIGFPAVVLVGAVQPRLIESTLLSLLNVDTLIGSQFSNPGFRGQGRLADLAPAFEQVAEAPLLGQGVGHRIVVGEFANSNILDNQWLGTLLDAGVFGVAALAAFLLVPAGMLLRYAFDRSMEPRRTHLAFALALSVIGYGVAMFFYDAFSFMQTFLILGVLLAVGAWLLSETGPMARRDLLPVPPTKWSGRRSTQAQR